MSLLPALALLLAQDSASSMVEQPTPADALIACAASNIPADMMMRLVDGAFDDLASDEPVLAGEVDEVEVDQTQSLQILADRCGDSRPDMQLPVALAAGHELMTRLQDRLAAHVHISGERRRAFEAVLQPFADDMASRAISSGVPDNAFPELDVDRETASRIRAALSGAGFDIMIGHRALRTYVAALAAPQVIRFRLARRLSTQP